MCNLRLFTLSHLKFWSFRSCWEKEALQQEETSRNHNRLCIVCPGNDNNWIGNIHMEEETQKPRFEIRPGLWELLMHDSRLIAKIFYFLFCKLLIENIIGSKRMLFIKYLFNFFKSNHLLLFQRWQKEILGRNVTMWAGRKTLSYQYLIWQPLPMRLITSQTTRSWGKVALDLSTR